MCKEKFDGMVVTKAPNHWTMQIQVGYDVFHTVCSRKDVYMDLDDMCDGCA